MASATGHTRLSALHDRTSLKALHKPQLDEVTHLAMSVCAMPMGGVNIFEDQAFLGPAVEVLQEEQGLCRTAIEGDDVFVVPDTRADARFANGLRVRESPWIRFYAGAPLIMPDGDRVGVLWVGDRSPHERETFEAQPLMTLARQVVAQFALRRTNALLSQRENELRSIIDTSGEAIYGVDVSGRCTFVNPACLRMLGYSEPEALLGQEMHDLIHYAHADGAPYLKDECTVLRAFREGLSIRLEEEVFWRADRTPIWVIYTASPLFRDDKLIGSVINFVDVSEQRRLRHELVAAARVRDRFTGVLGHDLRNPLSTVLMGAQLIARSNVPDNTRCTALRVAQAAERMQRLIRDLLDFIRAREGGVLDLNPRPTDLAEIAREIVGELELANPKRRIELEVSGESSGSWDPDRLAQVCSNLLANAIHHGSPEAPVQIRIRSERDQTVLTVANRGTPIPAEIRPYLFDPFRRGDTDRHRGLGLGLFIVREIARAHGGDVVFMSDEGRTEFAVRLPRSGSSSADEK